MVMLNVWLTITPQFADAGVISFLLILVSMVPSQYWWKWSPSTDWRSVPSISCFHLYFQGCLSVYTVAIAHFNSFSFSVFYVHTLFMNSICFFFFLMLRTLSRASNFHPGVWRFRQVHCTLSLHRPTLCPWIFCRPPYVLVILFSHTNPLFWCASI